MVESYSNGFMYGKNCGGKANNSKYVIGRNLARKKKSDENYDRWLGLRKLKWNFKTITSKIKNQPNGIKEIKSKTIP